MLKNRKILFIYFSDGAFIIQFSYHIACDFKNSYRIINLVSQAIIQIQWIHYHFIINSLKQIHKMSLQVNTELIQSSNKLPVTLQDDLNILEEEQAISQPTKKKIISKIQKKQPKPEGINVGEWNETQNFLYASFLQANIAELHSQLKRRQTKIFVRMQKLISTRTADQCRSHHQKCMKKYKSVREIILALLFNKKNDELIPTECISFSNVNYNEFNYAFLPKHYCILSYQKEECKKCSCIQKTGQDHTKYMSNDQKLKMLAFMDEKFDEDKTLPKTGLGLQEDIKQSGKFFQVQEMMIEKTKQDKIYIFGGKIVNKMNNYLTKVNENKFKIKIRIEQISKWNTGY